MLRALGILIGLVALLCLTAGRVAAEGTGVDPSPVLQDPQEMIAPTATAAAETPTPVSTATPIPLKPNATPTAEPQPSTREYQTPGYGNAVQQKESYKKRERKDACKHTAKPPTSHMLGLPGVVRSPDHTNWVPLLLLAVAGGAALFVVLAVVLRKLGSASAPGNILEGIGTMVAICVGLAGIVTTMVPGATMDKRPERAVSMTVRDVKPRITRGEYLDKVLVRTPDADDLDNAGLSRTDLKEIGNVVWLNIHLDGFKGSPLELQYGSYDWNGEALLPGTSKVINLG
jgi:hypothetical protein